MDCHQFFEQISSLYENWGQSSAEPKAAHFYQILHDVQSLTTVNVMQLLNFAIDCMAPDEVYCEIGCFQGGSLIAALLNHSDKRAYAVDNFSEFDTFGDSFERLAGNLAQFNLADQVLFCHQEFEEFFANLREIQPEEKIGVFFYDAAHDYRSHLLALLLVKPFLADQALIILSQSHWQTVNQATWDFLASHSQGQLLLDFSMPEQSQSWNGLQVILWDVNQNFSDDCLTLQQSRHANVIQSIYNLSEDERQKEVQNLYQKALANYSLNQFLEAEKQFKMVLQAEPKKIEAWYHLGLIYYQTKRYYEAKEIFFKSLEVDNSQAIAYYNIGLIFETLGDFTQAVLAYQEAIRLNSQLIDAYNNLGNIFFLAGDWTQAESTYRQAILVYPGHYGSYLNLGKLLLTQQRLEEALQAYETALDLKPNDPDIQNSLTYLYSLKNEPQQAALSFAYDCYQQGNYQKAVSYYCQFLETQTGDAKLYLALADCYRKLEQYEAASATYQAAIPLFPDTIPLYRNLVSTLVESGQIEAAITFAGHSAILFPDELFFNPGQYFLLPILYNTAEDIAVYRQRYLQGMAQLCQTIALNREAENQKALTFLSQHSNFFLAYQGENDLEIQKQYGQWACQVMAANYPQWTQPLPLPPLSNTGRIRIGYLSGCLWGHTVGKLMLGWLQHHNVQDFEIYCYHINETQDAWTQQFRRYSDIFHYLPASLEQIGRQILADQLHILVFLDIGQQPQMTQLAALRLAPIQCTTWAHPITSGLPTLDYFLSSDLMEPENAQDHYSEQLIRLPNLGISYPKPTLPPLSQTRTAFELREDAVVYLCCQTLCKYLPQYDYLFAEIAQRVPQAQFVFIARPNAAIGRQFKQRLHRTFAQYCLNFEDFCVILPKVDQVTYWNLYNLADIFLDSFSWSGGQTTLEAIACNLPVVTCPGEWMRGRHTYAILRRLDVTETIANSEAEYLEISVRLGLEPTWRAEIVARILQHHISLYDDKSCVIALEAFYRQQVAEYS